MDYTDEDVVKGAKTATELQGLVEAHPGVLGTFAVSIEEFRSLFAYMHAIYERADRAERLLKFRLVEAEGARESEWVERARNVQAELDAERTEANKLRDRLSLQIDEVESVRNALASEQELLAQARRIMDSQERANADGSRSLARLREESESARANLATVSAALRSKEIALASLTGSLAASETTVLTQKAEIARLRAELGQADDTDEDDVDGDDL